jgi:RNA polymerase sigma-B factor
MAARTAATVSPAARDRLNTELLTRLDAARTEAERAEITHQLVELNLRLCDSIAIHYANRGADRDDLIQVGRLALLLAIRRFAVGEGRTFAAFAAPTIAGEIKRYFRDYCWVVRPPRRIQELRSRVAGERVALEQRLGRSAGADELAQALDADPKLVAEARVADSSYRPRSLEASLDSEGETSIAATLADPRDDYRRLIDRLTLQRALAGLTGRDRAILLWRFEEGATQAEIGRRLGISQMQVSRLIPRILSQARDAIGDERLAG